MTRTGRFFFSTKTMTALLFTFAISMATATFIENDYDTPTAKMLVYNAKWFEILMLWITIIFMVNIKIYQLTKREKWPILIFHLAFILMFSGGAVTRYWAFEGQMHIKEGETTNEIISDLTYLKVNISDGVQSTTYDQHPYSMSFLNQKNTGWPFKRNFKKSYVFNDKIISIKTLDYIPHAKDSIQNSSTDQKILTIITTGQNGRENNYIIHGEIKTIGGILFSFNNPIPGTVQLREKGDSIIINTPLAGTFLSMQGQQAGIVTDTALLLQHSGILNANELRSLDFRTIYSINNTNFIIPNPALTGKIVYYSGDKSNRSDKNLLSIVKLEISSEHEKDTLIVKGGKGITDYSAKANINRLKIAIGYGSKLIKTPFSLRCDDFKLDRYPGSNNASSYESRVTVIDDGNEKPHHIYMNNVMDYRGYRFFQASYYPDESGTILSVNKDWWGTRITYTSYFFLFLGMFLTLFRKQTHIWKLNQRLKAIHNKVMLLIPLILMLSIANAQHSIEGPKEGELGGQAISTNHADKFGHLLVQDFQGRIKPMDTHTLELLRKIYKKDSYKKLSPVQWFLSMQLDPAYWFVQPMIYVGKKGGNELAEATGANADGYTTFAHLMNITTGEFRLQNQYNQSFSKRKAEQSNYDKELINVTERYNIFGNIIYGYFTKIIPLRNDPSHTWRSWIYSSEKSPAELDSAAYAFIALY